MEKLFNLVTILAYHKDVALKFNCLRASVAKISPKSVIRPSK